jgi:zinc protease
MPRWTENTLKHVLANGLTVLVQRDASAPVVAVVTHVKAGYFDEPDEWVGIAHVLEHMYFKGTARRGPGAVAQETQLLGGYVNAGTIYDKTVYYTVLPSAGDGLTKALDIQADALMHLALDPDELRRELQVIIEEAKRKLDSPGAVAGEALYELLFRVHRMRRWRIGTEEGLRRLTAQDLRAYYESRYTPDRVILGIAGDLDPQVALAHAEVLYGAWTPPSATVEPSPPEPDGTRPQVKVLHGDVKRPIAVVGWRTVDALHPDAGPLDTASAVLSAGRGSHLYRAVRMPGLASGAAAVHYTPTEVGVFGVSLEGEAGKIDEAVERAAGLVRRLASRGPDADDLERVKALTVTQWARRFESSDGRAASLCEAEALGDFRLLDEMYDRALSMTADEVQGAAARRLDTVDASGVFYLPHEVDTRWTNGAWPPSGAVQLELSGNGEVARASRTPRPAGRSPSDETYPGGITARRHAGVDHVVRPKRGAGLVNVSLQIPGVRVRETTSSAGVSWLTARCAVRGAGGLSAEQLARAVERLGGGIAPSVTSETVGWWITVRADALHAAAELLKLVALEPTLAPDDVAVERDLLVSDAMSVRDDMLRHPIQQVKALAFRGHAYALPALGEPESVAALDAAAVADWTRRLAARRAVVVAVGDLDTANLLAGLEPLAAWPGGADGGPDVQAPIWRADCGHEDRQKAQTALAMAFPASPFGSPDRYPTSILSAVMSGLAGRLFDELREKRSLAYTVATMPWLAEHAGAMLAYIATSPEREDEAREAMIAELARAATDITAEELERARQYAAGSVEVGRQSGRAVAEEILAGWVHGVVEDFAIVSDRLRSVTLDDVRRVAGAIFQPERRAEYVVHGRKGE